MLLSRVSCGQRIMRYPISLRAGRVPAGRWRGEWYHVACEV